MLVIIVEEDEGIVFPHNNAIVVNLNVKNYDVHRTLIDNRSSTDVLYFDALMKMGISPDQLARVDSPDKSIKYPNLSIKLKIN